MRIVAISDTHCRHQGLRLPEGDVLVHAGDMSLTGSYLEIVSFIFWFQEQPFKHKVLIAGNHDFYFERHPENVASLTQNITYLQDQMTEIDGVRFYGMPWTPEFNGWAFNLERRGRDMVRKCEQIPTSTDVLITHGPPYHILDDSPDGRFGCLDLLVAVRRVQPKVHIFGHNHMGYGAMAWYHTRFNNVSTCDMACNPVNLPVVIDLE